MTNVTSRSRARHTQTRARAHTHLLDPVSLFFVELPTTAVAAAVVVAAAAAGSEVFLGRENLQELIEHRHHAHRVR